MTREMAARCGVLYFSLKGWKTIETVETRRCGGICAQVRGMVLYKQLPLQVHSYRHLHLLHIDKTLICPERLSQLAMGANSSHAVASVLPEWIMTPQTHRVVLVEEEYAVEIKTVTAAEFHTRTPATPSVTPKTTTVVNTGAPRSTPAHGNASGKKRKHIDM